MRRASLAAASIAACVAAALSFAPSSSAFMVPGKFPIGFGALHHRIALGGSHSCVAFGDGTARCFGYNHYGQLGDGTTTSLFRPYTIPNLPDVVEVGAGWDHSCARLGDGTVWCWGEGDGGELGSGTSTDSFVPVQAKAPGGAFVNIALMREQSCGVLNDGTVACWGRMAAQNGPASTTSAIPTRVPGVDRATQVATGCGHSCARREDSSLVCWGADDSGQLGDGQQRPSASAYLVKALGNEVVGVATGCEFTCALLTSGHVKCWGSNSADQIGIAPSVALTPFEIPLNGVAAQVAAGWAYACARMVDGTVQCWGENDNSQLGDGTTINQATPIPVQNVTGAIEISLGSLHACALVAGGGAKCWGHDDDGQLGNGTTMKSSTAIAVVW